MIKAEIENIIFIWFEMKRKLSFESRGDSLIQLREKGSSYPNILIHVNRRTLEYHDKFYLEFCNVFDTIYRNQFEYILKKWVQISYNLRIFYVETFD